MPLSKKAEGLIEQLIESGDSQSLAVGECLQGIAENGAEQSTNKYLVGCAEEIISAAQGFINELSRKRKRRGKASTEHCPTPWHTEPLQWDQGASIAIVCGNSGPDGSYIVATIAPENEDDEPDASTAKRGPCDEANAEFICLAVNQHDALAELARVAAGMTMDRECMECLKDGDAANPDCEDHDPHDMESDDAVEALHSLIRMAREATR